MRQTGNIAPAVAIAAPTPAEVLDRETYDEPKTAHMTGEGDRIGLAMNIADAGGQVYRAYIRTAYERGFRYTTTTEWMTVKPLEATALRALGAAGVLTHVHSFVTKSGFDAGSAWLVGDSAVVWLHYTSLNVAVSISAASAEIIHNIIALLKAVYPEPTFPDPKPRVTVAFWMLDTTGGGGSQITRTLDVVEWPAISLNYTAPVKGALEEMMAFKPSTSGQLFLWHGIPGTGKTYALRALAWQWRHWCDLYYITDPNTLLNGPTQYMNDVLLDENEGYTGAWIRRESEENKKKVLTGEDRWRLLVLEDAGELMTVTARQDAGPGLGRLLNMVDGLLGQGMKFLVLLTTNEPMKKLHPAVTRPGRCAARIEFDKLTPSEVLEFGRINNIKPELLPAKAVTIADLYALNTKQVVVEKKEEQVGF